MNPNHITITIDHLKAGRVVAIPTETVYGLAANAYDLEAVKKIFLIKKRPFTSPLIVHTHSLSSLSEFVAPLPPQAKLLAEHFWPGGLTLLLKKKAIIPSIVTAGLPTVGVRIPSHPLTQQLLKALPFPIAAPSANPFGYISPTTAEHVKKQLGEEVAYILNGGPAMLGLESTIIGFENAKTILYRQGSIPEEAIQKIVGPLTHYQKKSEQKNAVPTSGTLLSHYAPRTPFLVGDIQQLIKQYPNDTLGILAFDQYFEEIPQKQQFLLAPKGSLEEAASRLFQGMHHLDSLNFNKIITSYVIDQGVGKAINDRLTRASYTGHSS